MTADDAVVAVLDALEGVTGTTRYLIELARSPFVRVQVLGRVALVATAEDMIVTKLRWAIDAGRLKDREDIRNILAVRGAELDWGYLSRWAAEHGTAALLAEIRASIPSA